MYDIIFTVSNDLNYDQRMHRICQSLESCGYKVLLLGRQKHNSIPVKSYDYHQKRMNCWFQKGFLFYAELNIRLFFFLMRTSTKAICSIDLDTLTACYLSSRIRNRKLVFDAHEYYLGSPELVDRNLVRGFWRLISNFALPRISFNYTVSSSVKKAYEKDYGTQFEVIRNFPLYKKSEDVQKVDKLLIYQGVLNEGRGLKLLISCLAIRKDWRLWLCGNGDIIESLKAQTSELEITNQVKYFGALPPDELVKITPNAFIGINLLEGKSQNNYFSLANKFFDYVQAGIPVLTMDFPEYRIHNQEYEVACLITQLDKASILAALDKMIKDEGYYNKLAENCKLASSEWTWESEEPKLIEFYRKVFATA